MTKGKLGTKLTTEETAKLRQAIVTMAVAIVNNTTMIKAGYDIAVTKPELLKRKPIVNESVVKAADAIKPVLETFIDEVASIVGAPMPPVWSRAEPMKQEPAAQ